ncbi:MAG: phosphatase PAP2 family protein [Clostridia bacterium]|nr:phosphatase PAP2 family protein [Clostridia bacterium]
MSKLFKLIKTKYSHVIMLGYFLIYMPWFTWLNGFTPQRENLTEMYSRVDDLIPFCELFVIPYFLWFAYIAVGYVFLFFNNRSDFLRMCAFLYIGMTTCLIIYMIFPNYQALRVDYEALGRSNFLIEAIRLLQMGDSPHDVFPSIHCLNSIGMNIALAKNEWCKKHTPVLIGATILTTLICLSTVFVKQHSILDLYGAIALSIPLYIISYKIDWKKILSKRKKLT